MKNLFASVLILFTFLNLASAYTVHISAPAVIVNIDRGVLTSIYLNVTTGNGAVTVNSGVRNGTVGTDTVQSAQIAANYAASYLSLNESKYNFNFTIRTSDSNVSGPSAGLAMTLLAVAGLEHRQLNPNFTVTGTINASGGVGQIGGVYDKVQAAKTINAKYILVPYLTHSNYQSLLYYLSQEAYNIPVIEVKNASQAIPYALGNPQVTPLNYSMYINYQPSGLPPANATCASCNDTAFGELANFTFNFTQMQINSLDSSKFAGIQSQLKNQLSEYSQIGSKGYLYTSADLAFIAFPTSFMFSNYNNSDSASALTVLNNISDYCNSVSSPPQLTNTNYEYVFGGEARHYWAESTLNAAYQELNNSQTSDDVLSIIQAAAPAYSWCMATNEMYKIASSLKGNATSYSPNVASKALSALHAAQKYSIRLLYVNATAQAYNSGEYGAALYSAEYANIFYNDANLAAPTNTVVEKAVSNASSSPDGIWAQQFALQSQFYLYEASVSNQTVAPAYLNNAYTTALLSTGIGNVNSYIQNNLVLNTTSQNVSSLTSQVSQLQNQIQLVLASLVILIVLILIILAVLLLHMTSHKNEPQQASNAPSASQQSVMPAQSPKRRITRKKDLNA